MAGLLDLALLQIVAEAKAIFKRANVANVGLWPWIQLANATLPHGHAAKRLLASIRASGAARHTAAAGEFKRNIFPRYSGLEDEQDAGQRCAIAYTACPGVARRYLSLADFLGRLVLERS